MKQSCTKFRVFSVLLVIGVFSAFVYTQLFMYGSPLWTQWLYGGVGGSGLNGTLWPHPTAYTAKGDQPVDALVQKVNASEVKGTQLKMNNDSRVEKGEQEEVLRPLWGPAKLMQAFNVTVVPRANVTPPWAPDNTTKLCPPDPPKLVGPLATYKEAPSFDEIVKLNPGLEPGGHFHPPDCRARSRVAIIIPYRNRTEHLRILLHNLHPMLQRQQLDYFILVVEMAMPTTFNRGMLLNIGAVEALGLWDVECFVFHDVDLVPENDRNRYVCSESPRHLSVAIDKYKYRPLHSRIFGGAVAIKREHFFKVNGYPNKYFGWGGEDDDLSERIRSFGFKLARYDGNIPRYQMIKHDRDYKNEPNPKRYPMLNSWKNRHKTDGLNTLKYNLTEVEFRPAYTWMFVHIDEDAVKKG